jgi:hypothetical protein
MKPRIGHGKKNLLSTRGVATCRLRKLLQAAAAADLTQRNNVNFLQ